MLDKHLIVKTYGKADEKNIIVWQDYRVTVLGEGLFRLENNTAHIWRDNATQCVWYRNAPKQSFSVNKTDGECVISTNAVMLVLKPDRKQCHVVLGGKNIPIDNSQNLLGTCRTLDNCDGDTEEYAWKPKLLTRKVKLGNGVCSKNGVAVLDDGLSLTLDDNGKIIAERGAGSDEYIFAFGKDYRGAVRALYEITGYTPMLPRYSLGNWWSRYYPYTESEYLIVLDNFARRGIPLTVATIDMDWHYTDIDNEFGITAKGDPVFYGGTSGWTGYGWNKHLFPDYKAFLKRISDRNLKITLNVHPADGIRFFDDNYKSMATAMGKDPATEEAIRFDVTDDRFINNYFSCIHKPYEQDGVAFWWIDWQQGTKSDLDGLDPLWSLNHYHYLDNGLNNENPIILSRYAGVGSHRYPVGFSGDTHITWNTLSFLPYFTATASNIGYGWWSHDIGGHMGGKTDGELYARSVQFGVFSPINRLHSMCAKVVSKEPWAYGNGVGLIATEFLKFRHGLIPFLYTADYLSHEQGKTLVEPMYYEYPDCENAYDNSRDQYLFGGLIVAPAISPQDPDGFTRIKVWLPRGKYTDVFTKEEYDIKDENGRQMTLFRRLDSIPVLAKAGTVLPLSCDSGNSVANPQTLEVKVFSGDGAYSLYEDGENGKKHFTDFKVSQSGKTVTLDISGKGDDEVVPKNRTLRIVFENIYNGSVELFVNGKKCENAVDYADNVTVVITNYDPNKKYKIVAVDNNSELDNIKLRLTDALMRAECGNYDKDRWHKQLLAAKSEKELHEVIDKIELGDIVIAKLNENLIND